MYEKLNQCLNGVFTAYGGVKIVIATTLLVDWQLTMLLKFIVRTIAIDKPSTA